MQSDKKNSSWLALQYIIALVFSLIALKLNINSFGEETFGVWIVLSSLWGFSTTIDFGFGIAIIKYVAQYKEEYGSVNKILSSVFFVFVLIGVMIFTVCIILAYSLYFNSGFIPLHQLEIFKTVFLILGAAFLLQYISFFFKSIIEGLNNFTVTSIVIISQYTLILFGVIIVYYLELNIIWLSLVYLLTYAVMLCIYFFYYFSKIKIYSIRLSLFELKEAKSIFRFSFSVQLMNIFYALIDPIIKYLIGNYYNISAVPSYEIARRVALSISGLFFNTFRIILPKASALKTKDETIIFIKEEVLRYSKIGVVYSGLAFGIFLFPLILFLYFTFGIKESLIIFMILALPESINNFGYSIYNFLLGVGKVNLLAFIQFNNLVFSTVGVFIGFNIFNNSFGLLGYFFSVIIANVMMIYYLKKNWGIQFSKIIKDSRLDKLLFLLLSMCVITSMIYSEWIQLFVFLPVYSIVMLLFFYKDLRLLIINLILPLIGVYKNS